MTTFKRLMMSAALALLCSMPVAQGWAADTGAREIRVDITAQPLRMALTQFAQQAGVQLLFSEDEVPVNIDGPRLVGTYTLQQALTELLAQTTLRAQFINARTVAIRSGDSVQTSDRSEPLALRLVQTDGTSSVKRVADAQPGAAANAQVSSNNKTPESSDDAGTKIQEIVVTAQKREERLQDVPISISVLGGKDLDRSSSRGVADALNRVPGVISSTTSGGVGNARNGAWSAGGVVIVRGVAPAAGASVTGYYLDTIPFGFVDISIAPDPSAYDLERVEVLRGPQGTLYGVNALNGVVRVLTKDADLNKFELKGRGGVSSTTGGGENYRGDVAVNVPLVEGKLAARAVVGYQDWSGWIDKPIEKDANDTRVGNYRLKINAQPTEKLSAELFGWASQADIGAPATAADGRNSVSLLNEPNTVDYEAYGFKLGYDLPAFTVTSMTSYLDYKAYSALDYRPFVPAETVILTNNDTRMFSQEILLNSTAPGPWRWALGGMYRNANDHVHQYRSLYPAPTGTDNGVESTSTTAFGELTRAFMDGRFELTGGLRYFQDKKRNWETSRAFFTNGVINPATGLFGLFPDITDKYNKVTPKAVLTWHPNTQATIYASYAEGFRSGINQGPATKTAAPQFPSAKPDYLKSYELGTKGSAWDGRLNFDGAVYYLDWKGVQQSLSVVLSTNPYALGGAVVNAQSASGMGAEFGVSVEPVEGLTLATNVSWNDLQVDENVVNTTSTTVVVLYPKGGRINMSPEHTVSVSADYAFPLGANGFKGRLGVAGNYLPKMIGDRSTATGALFYTEAVRMVRASFAVESAGRWTASLYGDNLTDEQGISFDQFSPRWNASIRPRTIGVQVEYRY